jgi:N-acetylglucosaminyldiphosphoundecaprenol N-acetyl-beta-D-mannosaminyltransferase
MNSEPALETRRVLGTTVHCVTYDSALRQVEALARGPRPAAVSACNTHLVSLARADFSFHGVMERFDLVAPDGYPLIWRLNAQGAHLRDRVYGPYLMRHVLAQTPAPWKHFFFGGTDDCLRRLCAAAKELNPDIAIAGTLSPPFRQWTEEDEENFARTIRESGADFVWVALGGERQERWIVRNLHRYTRGVFFAVGDAFELLAGGRPFAPGWMQKLGLTWLYRLAQEPRRLWARYLKFNSLFLWFTLRDGLVGTPRRFAGEKPRVAFLGSRGVPARYSGFEVVVENLGSRLAGRGYPVTVYNRYPRFDLPSKIYRGMRVVVLPTIPTKSLDTISHTALSALHALTQNFDVIYLCGVGNAIIGGFLRLLGYKVIINVDGADFNRAKWGSLARAWLRISERWAIRIGHKVIADNSEIVTRYQREYGATPLHLSYGAILRPEPVHCGELAHWNLAPRSYILFVSRLTPENQADLLLRAYRRYQGPLRLVICGGANYEHAYYRKLRELADDRVLFTGPRYGDSYLELSQNAAFYVMPADIEATRLVLLDQLGMGTAILYHECAATREVVADAAEPFAADRPEDALLEKLDLLSRSPERCEELRRLALERARSTFHWEMVVDRYEELFEEIGVPTGRR